MGETFESGVKILSNAFNEGIQSSMEERVLQLKTPEELNDYVPMDLVVNDQKYRTFESPKYLVKEALKKDGFLNIAFFIHENSCYFRDNRLARPVGLRNLQQLIVLHGKIYIRRLELFEKPKREFEEIPFERVMGRVESWERA